MIFCGMETTHLCSSRGDSHLEQVALFQYSRVQAEVLQRCTEVARAIHIAILIAAATFHHALRQSTERKPLPEHIFVTAIYCHGLKSLRPSRFGYTD